MKVTKEQLTNGMNKTIQTYQQVGKMAQCDGSKESCLKLIQEVYPEMTWDGLNTMLIVMEHGKLIEGITIADKQVMEPIRPRLTNNAEREIKTRKDILRGM